MQKLPSVGKFHFEPPFTSLDDLVGSGEQTGKTGDKPKPDRILANAEDGHTAAAPPSSGMNARRVTQSPRRRGR